MSRGAGSLVATQTMALAYWVQYGTHGAGSLDASTDHVAQATALA